MRPYLSCFGAALRMTLQYRAAALAGVATQIFWGLLRIAVFSAFYASLRHDRQLPMTLPQVIDYIWLGQAFLALTPVRADPSVEALMKDGSIAYELARPVDLYGFWFSRAVSLRLGPALLRAPPLLLFAWLLPEGLCMSAPASSAALGLFALSLALGVLLSAAMTVILGVLTVYTLKGEGASLVLTMCAWVLCSMVPAPLLPPVLRTIMEWSPFAAMLDLPFRLYVGQLTVDAALPILLRQVCWAVTLIATGRWLLSAALTRVVVQGG